MYPICIPRSQEDFEGIQAVKTDEKEDLRRSTSRVTSITQPPPRLSSRRQATVLAHTTNNPRRCNMVPTGTIESTAIMTP
jgi:hypothetical protein